VKPGPIPVRIHSKVETNERKHGREVKKIAEKRG
jgi:hypothetical protein